MAGIGRARGELAGRGPGRHRRRGHDYRHRPGRRRPRHRIRPSPSPRPAPPVRLLSGDMNQILPYPLWTGHAGDGRDYRRVLDHGIRAVVQLAAEEPPLQPPRELIYLRFPLNDGADNADDLLVLAV